MAYASFAKGTVLNPNPPAPLRARMTSAYRAFDAVHDALSKAMPDWVPSQGYNCTTALYIMQRGQDGRYRMFLDILGGGYGIFIWGGARPLGTDGPLTTPGRTPLQATQLEVDMPIAYGVQSVLSGEVTPAEAGKLLMSRQLKSESE